MTSHQIRLLHSIDTGMQPMPNQRSDKRKQLSTWLFESDFEELKKIAKKEGLSLPDLLANLIDEHKKLRREKGDK